MNFVSICLDACYLGGIVVPVVSQAVYAFLFSFSVSNHTLCLMQSYRHVCVRQTDNSLETGVLIFLFDQLRLQYK